MNKNSNPKRGGRAVLPLVVSDLIERANEGFEKYGCPLETNNGRSALLDAYEEAQDLTMYLRQRLEEEKSEMKANRAEVPTANAYSVPVTFENTQPTPTMRLYLARPITGCSYGGVASYYALMKAQLEGQFRVLSPMTAKGFLRTEKRFKAEYNDHPVSTNHAIIERDRWMVKRADVLYANLVGSQDVSIGTVMELAWGHDNGIHTIIAMEKDNPHYHAFVLEAGDIVFESHEEALAYLKELAR